MHYSAEHYISGLVIAIMKLSVLNWNFFNSFSFDVYRVDLRIRERLCLW